MSSRGRHTRHAVLRLAPRGVDIDPVAPCEVSDVRERRSGDAAVTQDHDVVAPAGQPGTDDVTGTSVELVAIGTLDDDGVEADRRDAQPRDRIAVLRMHRRGRRCELGAQLPLRAVGRPAGHDDEIDHERQQQKSGDADPPPGAARRARAPIARRSTFGDRTRAGSSGCKPGAIVLHATRFGARCCDPRAARRDG